MKNFIQPGQVVTMTAAAPVVAGVPTQVGTLVGIPTGSLSAEDIAAGRDQFEMVLGGVYEVADDNTIADAQGKQVAWDDTNKTLIATTTGDFELGKVIKVAADGVAHVLLNGRGEASGY